MVMEFFRNKRRLLMLIKIIAKRGLHVRPSAELAKIIKDIKGDVFFRKKSLAPKKIETALDILTLQVGQDETLEVIVKPNCPSAISKLCNAIKSINCMQYP